MHSGLPPIGFEGVFTRDVKMSIGFEQFENEQKETMTPAYPLGLFLKSMLEFSYVYIFL